MHFEVCGFSGRNKRRAADLHEAQVCATPISCVSGFLFRRFGPGAGTRLSIERYLHLDEAAGSRGIDSGYDLFDVAP